MNKDYMYTYFDLHSINIAINPPSWLLQEYKILNNKLISIDTYTRDFTSQMWYPVEKKEK